LLLPCCSVKEAQKQLSVIAFHRQLGHKSLSQLKERVRRFASDHTFKETARNFGIHHSTVSGWIKAAQKQQEQEIVQFEFSHRFNTD
jgi:transposase-like protein